MYPCDATGIPHASESPERVSARECPAARVVENAVLNYSDTPADKPDASLMLSKSTLDSIQLKEKTIEQAIASGDLKLTGKEKALNFMGLPDAFPFWFNIVTP
jgi:alkyl sulfatase BDS1-like metallo-beta-lactamase superfamily hydrolase